MSCLFPARSSGNSRVGIHSEMHTWHDKSIQSNKYVYILQKCKTTRTFVKNLFMGDVTLNDADKDQSNLLFEIVKFGRVTKPGEVERKKIELRYLWKQKCTLWR